MKILVRHICIMFLLCTGISANAQQMTFTLSDMTRIGNTAQWRYGTVQCNSTNNATSIIVSMINNQIASNTSGVNPSNTFTSTGVNPRTILYLFSPPIPDTDVVDFIEGMTFTQENNSQTLGANPSVNITVDANPTKIPAGATITAWNDHPDGTPHYYVWVASASIHYVTAYNNAKSYYLQGMRGYLPTITSSEESAKLTNISTSQGWSAGVRTRDNIADQKTIASNPSATTGMGSYGYTGDNYRWICGPETGFQYYKGPTYNTAGAGSIGGAFSGWNPTEPNNAGNENCMQVNHTNLKWNDYAATQAAIQGYFIEFGGGTAYKVGSTNYQANPKYDIPTVYTDNDQWYQFSPGNRASTTTTFKPNSMRSNVLVIE